MEPRICVNIWCRATSALEWRKGWPLQSGEYVDLCDHCGSAYDNSVFCETFHAGESGWRDCNYCQKRIHCGCIVSRQLFDHLDYGGIKCTDCPKRGQLHTFSLTGIRRANEDESMHLYRFVDSGENSLSLQPQVVEPQALPVKANHDLMHLLRGTGVDIPNVVQPSIGMSSEDDHIKMQDKLKDLKKSLSHTPINIDQGDPIGGPNLAVPISESHQQESEPCTAPAPFPFVQGACSHPILPSLSNPGSSAGVETSKLAVPQVRVARPPAEGRGKNQLLPRYWPRITDQELKQLSGDLNSNIVPLFEKVLSASDAGRIGRLVLPKACAEAYFPSISQSEGVPVTIQDVKGNEWTFQFRFWPNNNSRMYVLEGVTPCIQAMQLRAGDTVIFSRINPGSKLVMGFRKSSHSVKPQSNGTSSGTPSRPFLGNVVGGYADAVNGTKDSLPNSPFENLNGAGDDVSQHGAGSGVIVGSDDATRLPVVSGKKKTRNIRLKSRRTLMHNEDVMEVRLTWEEAQDLLRPPPNASPNVVTVEGHDFEEYDEPPVFGKRTLYISRSSGDQEQWAQCDDCSKWRRLAIDDLLPSKWTCSDNIWDPARRCCSAPDEMTPKELDGLLRLSRDSKKRRLAENQNGSSTLDNETCGLDALARIAALGEGVEEPLGPGETSLGTTTKHPRHRAGCSCIVCIQPPSGKGKHKPTCTCNVCMTVKRRFKTLMLRKKKQHWQRDHGLGADAESIAVHTDFVSRQVITDVASASFNKGGGVAAAENGSNNGQIDLNCDPDRGDVEGFDDGAHKTHLDIDPTCLVIEDHLTRQTTPSNFQQDQPQPLDILNFNELGLRCMEGAPIEDNEKHLVIQETDEEVIAPRRTEG